MTTAYAEPQIGFTAPTVIYEKMRDIQRAAAGLDADVQAHVTSAVFRHNWDTWYANWRAFFIKYQSTSEKAGAIFYTDDLNRQVETYRLQLLGFFDDYRKQTGTDGKPVPAPSGEPPTRAPDESNPIQLLPGSGWSLPWWVWMLGGVAAVGAGYYLYRTYLGKPLSIAKGVFRHDADPYDTNVPHGQPGYPRRDLPYVPMTLGDALRRPLPLRTYGRPVHARPVLPMTYRPYQHPHMVLGDRGGYYTPDPHDPSDVYDDLSTGPDYDHDFDYDD